MSTLIESLAQDHHAQRYHRPQTTQTTQTTQTKRADVARAYAPARETTRSRAGWLLVGLGLRLALPGARGSARRITLLGR